MMIDAYIRNQVAPMASKSGLRHEESPPNKKSYLNSEIIQDSKLHNSLHDGNKRKVSKQRPASANSAGRFRAFMFGDYQEKQKLFDKEVYFLSMLLMGLIIVVVSFVSCSKNKYK